MQASAHLRLFLSHIAGGIVGIWIGILVYICVSLIGSSLFPSPGCSGLPFCGTGDFVVLLLAGSGGGAIGGVVGYLIPQYLLRRSVAHSQLYGYAIVGAMLWIIIGIFTLFSVAISGLDRMLGWELATAAMLTLIGILIGLVRASAAPTG
jgi:hypothetical protein